MIADRLNNKMAGSGFQRMDSNHPGLYLYYMADSRGVTIISVLHIKNGNELTPVHYSQLLQKEKDSLGRVYPGVIRLLSLIFTDNPDQAKHLFAGDSLDSHWIIDTGLNRLMQYETQTEDYTQIRDMIEHVLAEEAVQITNPVKEASPFTLVNTGLIIINILVFLIVQYTPVFGGGENAFLRGSLSWYYVFDEKQYYRLLTSMFMHMDFSHLLNNMLVMLFIGAILERAVGRLKYPLIYFGTGILAGFTSMGYNMWKENASFVLGDSVMAIGASGAIFGLIGAVLCIVIVNRGRLEQIGTRQMIIFAALSIYGGIINPRTDSAAHIGGFLGGMLLALLLYHRNKTRLKLR